MDAETVLALVIVVAVLAYFVGAMAEHRATIDERDRADVAQRRSADLADQLYIERMRSRYLLQTWEGVRPHPMPEAGGLAQRIAQARLWS